MRISIVEEYQDVFSDVPKVTHLIQQKIQLTSKEPIRSRRISSDCHYFLIRLLMYKKFH